MELIELIDPGGPINWVLFGLMCVCFCQCLERAIYFFLTRKKSKNAPLLRLQQKDMQLVHLDSQRRKRELEKEGGLLYHEMNRGMWFLNFTGSVAPSLGLLGTVTGLIAAFGVMAEAGATVDMQALSGGGGNLGGHAHHRIRNDNIHSRPPVLQNLSAYHREADDVPEHV